MNWSPFEFGNAADVQAFDLARPFGEDTFRKNTKGHKKSLSATAKPFVPGASLLGGGGETEAESSEGEQPPAEEEEVEVAAPETLEEEREIVAGALGESIEPDRPAPTVEDDDQAAVETRAVADESQSASASASEAKKARPVTRRATPPPPAPRGLAASRFAVASPPRPAAAEPPSPSPSPVREDEPRSPVSLLEEAAADDTLPRRR
ncbi:hypothetical protein VTK73DRAFT_6121 [Phialemonium thermophilum]|uniref:Uncharacterized protein n=1 Tax=Phialemonium thermophilum TaxID=223376 RepID=A0ABR3V131_9PEZI